MPRLFKRLGPARGGWIEVDNLNSQIRNGNSLAIVDVRGRNEFDGLLGHIPSALNIPLGDALSQLTQINARKSQPVILPLRMDKCSTRVAALFREFHVMRSGMERWIQNGFEAVKIGENK